MGGLTLKKLVSDKLGVFVLTIIFIVDLIYLSNTAANVPVMDYWRYGQKLLYEIFNGGIEFRTLWESVNGQRGFLTYVLYVINVKYFHWNTRAAVFFGAVITYITGLLLLEIFSSELKYAENEKDPDVESRDNRKEVQADRKTDTILKYLSVTGMVMILFNYIQFEIKTIEFSAPFSTVTMLIVINMYAADRILNHLDFSYKKVCGFTLFLSLSICFVYSAFFPAVVGAICICGAFHFISCFKRDGMKYIGKYITVGMGILCSAAVYFTEIQGISGSNHNLQIFMESIINGEFFKSIAVYLGSSIVHPFYVERAGFLLVYAAGVIVGMLYFVSAAVFIKNREKIHTYFPVMLILYTLLAGVLISYGRGTEFAPIYLSASRYAVQSKMGLIGVVMIFYQSISISNGQCRRKYADKLIKTIPVCMIIISMLLAQRAEFQISPYRRIYFEGLIEAMYDIENKEDNELAGFQANDALQVRQTIADMKKYRLGVFYYLPDDGRFDQTARDADE